MAKQADSGAWSILAAIAAPFAAAAAKAILSRRRRTNTDKGEQEMCRNHSHVTGRIFGYKEEEDATEVRILVTQPLTVEASNGTRLTLPRYCVCSVRVDNRDVSQVSGLHQMAAQDEWGSFREELISTSGPIIQPK